MARVTKGLWVPLEAKPGKEADLARFLEGGQSIVEGRTRHDGVVRGPAG